MKYMCKCGMTFEKQATASNTALKLEEFFEQPYGRKHPCYGCPHVMEKLVWDRFSSDHPETLIVCYAAKDQVVYATEATGTNSSGCNLVVHTHDPELIGAIYEIYAEALPQENDYTCFQNRDDSLGRNVFSFTFPKGAQGDSCKKKILDEFFELTPTNSNYYLHFHRKGVLSEEEEYDCKLRIHEYKERFQMGNIERRIYQETGASGRYYFVHDMGGGRFKVHTAYELGDMDDPDKIYPSFYFRSCTTFEEAQVALDLHARNKGWTEAKPDEPESQLPEGGFDELYPEVEDLPPLRSTDHDYDPDPEEEEPEENPEDEQVTGKLPENNEQIEGEDENHGIAIEDHTSLRMEAFNEIMDLADERLNMALRKCLSSESTERFDLTIKITFEAAQGRVKPVMQESGYKFEPASYKVKTGVLDDIEIVLNSNGDPVILNNRPKQLTMDDLQPESTEPDMTVTADQSGVVEQIEFAEAEDGQD